MAQVKRQKGCEVAMLNIYMSPEQIEAEEKRAFRGFINSPEYKANAGNEFAFNILRGKAIRDGVADAAARHAVKQVVDAIEPNLGVLSTDKFSGKPTEYILSAECWQALIALAEKGS